MTALLGFVFLGLFSPGPNVILLTTSGARFGFARTLPHLAGVVVGVGITAGLTGLGLGALLQQAPGVKTGLTVLAALWILYLAWKLWNAKPAQKTDSDRPFTFLEAVLFQWVNPKVWGVAFAAMGYVQEAAPLQAALTLGLAFAGTNLFVCLFWSFTGSLLRRLLEDPTIWRIFIRTMAVLLAGFSALIFF